MALIPNLQSLIFGSGSKNKSPIVNVTNQKGQRMDTDHRVRINVPDSYIRATTRGPTGELYNNNGIIFPYTPQVSFEHKADYTSPSVMHTNFAQHFYQRSSVSAITITGKFTVQNDYDAGVYLSTIHLLRALTKMLVNGESNAGSPPPVCRLFAYGPYMLNNVPVSVNSFKTDLPDNVDYYALASASKPFGGSMVPVVSNISVTLLPMYSRNEQQQFTVDSWITGDLNKNGFL